MMGDEIKDRIKEIDVKLVRLGDAIHDFTRVKSHIDANGFPLTQKEERMVVRLLASYVPLAMKKARLILASLGEKE